MEKKEKKCWTKLIVVFSLMIVVLISIACTKVIDKGMQALLFNAFNIRANQDDLVVHYINVGQGDAIALQLPNDEIMLIDSGTKDSQNYLVEYIKTKVLKDNNNLVVDYFILTHSDLDHSGGACAVFAEFEVKNFYRPNIASLDEEAKDFYVQATTKEYNEAISLAKQEKGVNIEIIADDISFDIGKVGVQFFGPLRKYNTTNEISPLIKVGYLNKAFLFTGDVSSDAEDELVAKYGNKLKADVLKVGHHGSANATSKEFLSCVNPSVAIISVGANSYGHPSAYTISNLEQAGATIYRTDIDKDVLFVCGEGLFRRLESKEYHSFEFVNWWIIGLVLEGMLAIVLTKYIIQLVKLKKKEVESIS